MAFTLYETLIVVAIVSILVFISLISISKNLDKELGKLYTKAYSTLSLSCFNIQKDVEEFNATKDLQAQELGMSGAPDGDKKRFPNIKAAVTPKEADLCSALSSVDKGYLNIVTADCTIYANNVFLDNTPPKDGSSFQTTDGLKYYIAKVTDSDYYYIWVDINGSRGPNSTKFTKNNRHPDIVPFVINKENGVVVPQGIPIYDATYMNARVLYANPNLAKDYSRTMTYSQAVQIAYGGSTWTLDPLSVSKESVFTRTFPVPFTKPSKPTGVTSCPASGYVTTRDFPPCQVEVSKFVR